MKKHIFGLALFSFIVSAAAVVYAFFNVPKVVPVPEIVTVSAPQYVPFKKNSCRKNRSTKIKAVEIKQAVLNLQTEQFSWELATPDIDEPIALHFFSKDERGTHYITTERVNNKFSHNGILRYSSTYDWLNKRNSHENLYAIAEFEFEAENQFYDDTFQPKFDARKATAITVDYGK